MHKTIINTAQIIYIAQMMTKLNLVPINVKDCKAKYCKVKDRTYDK